jgi:hypothetical protein
MHLRFSQDLEILLKLLAEKPLTLGDILAETQERGFSLVIGLLVLPFLFPHVPGWTAVPGSACILLALQMAIGRRTPWLPGRIARFAFPKTLASMLLKGLGGVSRVLEKVARPRLSWIATNPHVWQLNGIFIAWLTVLLILPIPFTNPIPTIGILLLVVATLEADGLLMCFCYGYAIAISLGLAYLIWITPGLMQQVLGFRF